MSDLIDRQAAIDAISKIKRTDNWQATVSMILLELPSAQPERRPYHEEWVSALRTLPKIIRCGECKYYTPVTAHCEIRGKGLYLIRGMEDFCSRAEAKNVEND